MVNCVIPAYSCDRLIWESFPDIGAWGRQPKHTMHRGFVTIALHNFHVIIQSSGTKPEAPVLAKHGGSLSSST